MADDGGSVEPTQSLLLCILFTSISGLLRVIATMVLAYPDFLQKKQGTSAQVGTTCKCLYLAAHLFILAIAAVLSIIGTIFGPVSIAVPVQTGACLLFNVIAMGIVLKMRAFDKSQRTGTYVVLFSVLSLIDVGPGVQDNQDALQLLSTPNAIGWCIFIMSLMLVSAIGTLALLRNGESFLKTSYATTILVIGTCMSNVSMATSSKTFASLKGSAFVVALVLYLIATVVGVLFSVVSSTACDQGIFTPLSSVALIITNMITGIIVWEDWRVINMWTAYICACLLMCCGVYLLAEVDLLDKFYRKAMANVVLGPEPHQIVDNGGNDGEYGSFQQEEEVTELEVVTAHDSDTDAWQATLNGVT